MFLCSLYVHVHRSSCSQEAGKVPITSVEDSMPALSVPFPEPQAPPQASEPAVVLPHPSPMKGVKGSFLSHSPKRSVPSTPPKSPAAQALDDILARSHSRQAGQTPGSLTGKSPALLSRRRLSLTDDNKVLLYSAHVYYTCIQLCTCILSIRIPVFRTYRNHTAVRATVILQEHWNNTF